MPTPVFAMRVAKRDYIYLSHVGDMLRGGGAPRKKLIDFLEPYVAAGEGSDPMCPPIEEVIKNMKDVIRRLEDIKSTEDLGKREGLKVGCLKETDGLPSGGGGDNVRKLGFEERTVEASSVEGIDRLKGFPSPAIEGGLGTGVAGIGRKSRGLSAQRVLADVLVRSHLDEHGNDGCPMSEAKMIRRIQEELGVTRNQAMSATRKALKAFGGDYAIRRTRKKPCARRLDGETVRRIKEFAERGVSGAEIGRSLGSEKRTVNKNLERMGVVRGARPTKAA